MDSSSKELTYNFQKKLTSREFSLALICMGLSNKETFFIRGIMGRTSRKDPEGKMLVFYPLSCDVLQPRRVTSVSVKQIVSAI